VTPTLEFAYEARADLLPAVELGETPHGRRRMIPITGGVFEGPAIRGRILPGGADWQIIRADGVTEVDALYALETDDGAVIQVRNCGLRHGPPEIMERLAAGETIDPAAYYFRATPVFAASEGPHAWLNRSVFVCAGARFASTVTLRVFRVL